MFISWCRGDHNIHMKKCYHIERFPTRICFITLNDYQQFEKENSRNVIPYWFKGQQFARVFPFVKFKSIQCPSVPTRQSPPEKKAYKILEKYTVYTIQLALLLSEEHRGGRLTSWNLSACPIWERTAFFEVSWSQVEQVNLYSIFCHSVTCISPPRMSSSRMKYAFSKLKIMSSSHTDPKYLSSTSTYL